jgi:hypothetical protein
MSYEAHLAESPLEELGYHGREEEFLVSRWRETRIDREFSAHSLAMPIARYSV